jgi:microcystin degradation protein MlrC
VRSRIFIAGLFHETHTFVDGKTSLADFKIRRGAEMLACEGDASPLGGVLEYAKKQKWEIFPGIDYRAIPSGTVDDEVVETWWSEFEGAWQPDCDAIYLVLHGAMVAETIRDVEGELLARIRKLIGGDVPIFGVYDLHANFSFAMAANCDCLVAYRENPHSDAREAAVRAAGLLARCLAESARPKMYLRQTRIILPPTGVGTADDPMRSLEAAARGLEGGEVWALNIAAGFAFADTPDTGLSFQVVSSGSVESAEEFLDELEQLAEDLKAHGRSQDEALEDVMLQLLEPVDGLTLLVEPADNIGGGAPGDCTGCLRALIEHQIKNAAICINDPEAVTQLADVKIGEKISLGIGGKGSQLDEGPLNLEVELLSRSNGRFELEDKQSHMASMVGDFADMGDCALVRHARILILLTSNKTAPFDLGQWRSQGVDPAQLDVIVIKAAVAHKRAYDPITARSFWVDSPGPCSSNLKRFAYKHLRKGMWPL